MPPPASPTASRAACASPRTATIIGVIASPDHGGGQGKAAVYAPQLSREAILDGLRARHTYGTTGAKIWLDFRVDGRLMGEKLPLRAGPVPIDVTVSGPGVLESVSILRDGQVVHTALGDGGKQVSFRWTDPRPPVDGTYYYARVRQVDREMPWPSPVWFLRDPQAHQRRTGSSEPTD